MSQQQPSFADTSFGPAPQNAPNSEKPGAYELAVRADRAEVAPGENFHIDIFITGYGKISGAKIVFYPPPYFIDSQWSTVTAGLSGSPPHLYIGTKDHPLPEGGLTMDILGIHVPGWSNPSQFFDITGPPRYAEVYQIATESKYPRAPVEFDLHIRERTPSGASIPSGHHELSFYLTYFNGQEWKTASQKVDLTVPNFFKRHEGWTWTVGIATFVVTIAEPIISLLR